MLDLQPYTLPQAPKQEASTQDTVQRDRMARPIVAPTSDPDRQQQTPVIISPVYVEGRGRSLLAMNRIQFCKGTAKGATVGREWNHDVIAPRAKGIISSSRDRDSRKFRGGQSQKQLDKLVLIIIKRRSGLGANPCYGRSDDKMTERT